MKLESHHILITLLGTLTTSMFSVTAEGASLSFQEPRCLGASGVLITQLAPDDERIGTLKPNEYRIVAPRSGPHDKNHRRNVMLITKVSTVETVERLFGCQEAGKVSIYDGGLPHCDESCNDPETQVRMLQIIAPEPIVSLHRRRLDRAPTEVKSRVGQNACGSDERGGRCGKR